MRNLTINFGNALSIDRNVLIYRKGREGYGLMFNLVWRKITVPHNSVTPFTWDERYCFCIGKNHGNTHFDTLAGREARPGDQVMIDVDHYSSEMTFGHLTPNDRSNEFIITTGMFNPMGGSNDNCVGLGIDNKLFNVAVSIRPATNYVFAPLADYYIFATDEYNEGDLLTAEIEERAKKLEFSANGIIDIQIT
ncbi:MAG TPA: hypothetical protein VFE53_03670 [Mucilaginibacter sp.]|jgi:hypothetical protein|nr:hypothetical protein [Mucilaginibacter sp.]